MKTLLPFLGPKTTLVAVAIMLTLVAFGASAGEGG